MTDLEKLIECVRYYADKDNWTDIKAVSYMYSDDVQTWQDKVIDEGKTANRVLDELGINVTDG